jgi:1,4-alpha-glucan branching enzyme
MRKGSQPRSRCLVAVNFTPSVYRDYRVKVPFAGRWQEVLNSDSAHYGGSDVGNKGGVSTTDGLVPELRLTIPPLAAIFLHLEN